jgi:diguanylate cyclase (GGDEF)-like protein
VAGIAYCMNQRVGSWEQLINDWITLGGIGLLTYWTGGAQSPMWPLVFLFLVFSAWFVSGRALFRKLIWVDLVILSPLMYQAPKEIGAASGAALYAGVVFAFGLVVVMAFHLRNRDEAREQSEAMAAIDARTGLANRREFERRVEEMIGQLTYSSVDALAIVMIDLDNFKDVNTQHGHRAGDELLERIAGALTRCTREEDCLARVGGDEFAAAIPAVNSDTAQMLARRFVDAVREETGRSTLPACRAVTASAGFALYGLHGRTLDELVNAADVALMSVKNTGKGAERVSSFVVAL